MCFLLAWSIGHRPRNATVFCRRHHIRLSPGVAHLFCFPFCVSLPGVPSPTSSSFPRRVPCDGLTGDGFWSFPEFHFFFNTHLMPCNTHRHRVPFNTDRVLCYTYRMPCSTHRVSSNTHRKSDTAYWMPCNTHRILCNTHWTSCNTHRVTCNTQPLLRRTYQLAGLNSGGRFGQTNSEIIRYTK